MTAIVENQKETDVKKILVVEDERIIAINICSTLKQYGYHATYVSEANDAIEQIESEHFDLVLMDIMLNGPMDGIEIAARIKRTKEIPVIYLTAYSDEATINRAKTTEPFGYLIKPFNSRDLYISVEMAIYKSQVQKHIRIVESRLAENQKWETIALVASGISHEINNPLTSILNLADLILLEAKKTSNTSLKEKAEKITEESERIAKIVKNLVSYSQSTNSQWTYSNLISILNDTRSFLHQYFLKEGIQCEMEMGDVPHVYCQPQKIKQVLLNLIQDARLRVNTREDSIGRIITISLSLKQEAGKDFVQIQIKDNGSEDLLMGISQMNSLDVTRSIIAEHKGSLRRDEENSSWIFTLPIVNPV